MKRFLTILLVLLVLAASAHASPLTLLEDYADSVIIPWDENDPSAGRFEYSYCYPHVDENEEGGDNINVFYQDLIDYSVSFTIPMIRDAFEGADAATVISYQVTCNNDDYFSVLIRTERTNPDQSIVFWEGQVFSRKNGSPGLTYTLPKLLGTLASNESDTWLQDRQTEKADALIREMVWDRIEESGTEAGFPADFSEEMLSGIFFPEQDFYLDENGDPVFFLQPGDVFGDSAGDRELIVFPISLEEILDEL